MILLFQFPLLGYGFVPKVVGRWGNPRFYRGRDLPPRFWPFGSALGCGTLRYQVDACWNRGVDGTTFFGQCSIFPWKNGALKIVSGKKGRGDPNLRQPLFFLLNWVEGQPPFVDFKGIFQNRFEFRWNMLVHSNHSTNPQIARDMKLEQASFSVTIHKWRIFFLTDIRSCLSWANRWVERTWFQIFYKFWPSRGDNKDVDKYLFQSIHRLVIDRRFAA